MSHGLKFPKPFNQFFSSAIDQNVKFDKLVYILDSDPATVKAMLEESSHSIDYHLSVSAAGRLTIPNPPKS